MRKQATGEKRKIYAEILRLLPVTVLRFTFYALRFLPTPCFLPAVRSVELVVENFANSCFSCCFHNLYKVRYQHSKQVWLTNMQTFVANFLSYNITKCY